MILLQYKVSSYNHQKTDCSIKGLSQSDNMIW